MNKEANYNSTQTKNNNDKFWEIYGYFESISDKEHSAFQELLDFTIKNSRSHKKQK